jgi:hypothetical protein
MKKTFQVAITKSFLVTIEAENETIARNLTEFYTSDIQDLSLEKHRIEENFSIQEIECTYNEATEIQEIL